MSNSVIFILLFLVAYVWFFFIRNNSNNNKLIPGLHKAYQQKLPESRIPVESQPSTSNNIKPPPSPPAQPQSPSDNGYNNNYKYQISEETVLNS